MGIHSITTLVNGNSSTQNAIDMGFSASKALLAHNRVVYVAALPQQNIPFFGENINQSILDVTIDQVKKQNKKALKITQEIFNNALKKYSIPLLSDEENSITLPSASLINETGLINETIAYHGRTTDIIVIGRPKEAENSETNSTSDFLEVALFETGHGVLVSPPEFSGNFSMKKIAFLWRGSIEGGRALTGSLPFLQQAKSIKIIGDHKKIPITPIKHYFKCHQADIEIIDYDVDSSNSPSNEMMELCTKHNVDMLIMGAYVKGRIKNWIFGGVTSDILNNANIPVFMRI